MLREIDIDPYDKKEMKKYLHCDFFDAPQHRIAMRPYRFLVDDNGWPMDEEDADSRVAVVTSFGHPILYGNVILLAPKDATLFMDLTDEDIETIKKHVTMLPGMGLVVIL